MKYTKELHEGMEKTLNDLSKYTGQPNVFCGFESVAIRALLQEIEDLRALNKEIGNEFIDRCDKSYSELFGLHQYYQDAKNFNESTRILGKIEGLKLAKDYYTRILLEKKAREE